MEIKKNLILEHIPPTPHPFYVAYVPSLRAQTPKH